MDHSPLSKLSPELRNQIYKMVLKHEHNINIKPKNRATVMRAGGVNLALTTTCHAIRAESLQLFYASNHFHLWTHFLGSSFSKNAKWEASPARAMARVWQWTDMIRLTPTNLSSLSVLIIDLGTVRGTQQERTLGQRLESFRTHLVHMMSLQDHGLRLENVHISFVLAGAKREKLPSEISLKYKYPAFSVAAARLQIMLVLRAALRKLAAMDERITSRKKQEVEAWLYSWDTQVRKALFGKGEARRHPSNDGSSS